MYPRRRKLLSERIQAIRGMNDILPSQAPAWNGLENKIRECLNQYGYKEMRFPLVESTNLFKRTIGEITDIVEKEMYTFADLNGDSLTLRPEGTAGCVRACLEHGLLHNQQQKLWYMGPMFRHEKPQKGRYRQFTQLGVEAFGYSGVVIELEMIAMTWRLWKALGIHNSVELQINSLGELSERQVYKSNLVEYLKQHMDVLDEDSQRRLLKNPLRILDSKNPEIKTLLSKAPSLQDALGEKSKAHFSALCKGLDTLGIHYTVNPQLVRGLDYYGHTVIEWVTDQLGSQATICAGGRYDALVEQLGGTATSAFGFALGMERLLLLMETLQLGLTYDSSPTVFIMADSEPALEKAFIFAETLRNHCSDWTIFVNQSLGSFKSQFKKADKSGAQFALIFGEEEIKNHSVSIKELREGSGQRTLKQDECIRFLQDQGC